jgi:hypothetical protein
LAILHLGLEQNFIPDEFGVPADFIQCAVQPLAISKARDFPGKFFICHRLASPHK